MMPRLLSVFLTTVCAGLSLAGGIGCAGPAPASEFVHQADRMHRDALGGAVPLDTDLREYFHQVGRRLMDGARAAAPDRTRAPIWTQFQTHLVACDTINAFTTGGTHVYAYNGLFQSCRTEEELAAAVAHALAHAISLDVEQAGIRPRRDRPLNRVAWDFVNARFTGEQERRAHALAFDIYARAGWDPQKYGNLFAHLADQPGDAPGPAADRLALGARARSAEAMATRAADPRWRKPNVADRDTFAQLRRKAAALRESPPEQSEAVRFLRAFPNCILSADTAEQRAAQETLRPPPPREVEIEPS